MISRRFGDFMTPLSRVQVRVKLTIIIIIMLFNQGARITKGVIQ